MGWCGGGVAISSGPAGSRVGDCGERGALLFVMEDREGLGVTCRGATQRASPYLPPRQAFLIQQQANVFTNSSSLQFKTVYVLWVMSFRMDYDREYFYAKVKITLLKIPQFP